MNKKGSSILAENLIFIILNLVFLAILITFIALRMNGDAMIEEVHAKQIALMIDSAKPGTTIVLDIEDAFNKAIDNGYSGDIVVQDGNKITFQVREKGGYSYNFFNNINFTFYPDKAKNQYVFVFNEYN